MTPILDPSRHAVLSRAAFFVYLFFTFFGTSVPFQPRITDIENITTSNIVNQVVYTALFFISLFAILPKSRQLLLLVKKELFFSLFLLWSLLSISWSPYPLVSLKRLFQLFTSFVVISAFLLHSTSPQQTLSSLKLVLSLYLPLSLLAILTVPGALDPVHHTWRALAVGKNYLGQFAVLSCIIWAHAVSPALSIRNLLAYAMLGISLLLLVGSASMTALLTLLLLTAAAAVVFVDRRFETLGVGRSFLLSICVGLLILFCGAFVLGVDPIVEGLSIMERDTTFTGRTDLWGDLLHLAANKPVLGYGYGGFWVIDPHNTLLTDFYETYVYLPNQAHQGYLDVLIQTGGVGLLLLALMVIRYLTCLRHTRPEVFGRWAIYAILIFNLQESTLFFPRILSGELFLVCYLLLFRQMIAGDSPSYPG